MRLNLLLNELETLLGLLSHDISHSLCIALLHGVLLLLCLVHLLAYDCKSQVVIRSVLLHFHLKWQVVALFLVSLLNLFSFPTGLILVHSTCEISTAARCVTKPRVLSLHGCCSLGRVLLFPFHTRQVITLLHLPLRKLNLSV